MGRGPTQLRVQGPRGHQSSGEIFQVLPPRAPAPRARRTQVTNRSEGGPSQRRESQ